MKKITLDEFCNLKFVSNLEFSPNGKHLCFVVSQADREGNKYSSCIYTLKGKTVRQLTSGGREGSFQFLDEDTILFPGNRDESKAPSVGSKFYRMSLSGGEAVKAFTLPIPVEKLLPLPGGDFIVVGSTFPGFEDLYLGSRKRAEEYLKFVKDNEDYEVVDQMPWWWNGAGFTRSAYSSLFYYSARKKSLRRLTGENFAVADAKLNKDKTEVWFIGSEVRQYLPMDEGNDLYRLKIADGTMECLVKNGEHFSLQGFEFGDSFVLLMASDKKHGLNTDGDFYKLSYADHTVSLYRRYGEAIGSTVGSDVRYGHGRSVKMVGDTLYFISTIFDCAGLYKLEDGEVTRVSEKEGSVDCFDVCGDRIRLVALYDMRPQEIYDAAGNRYTKLNDKALAGKYVAEAERLNCVSGDHEIHGFVLKPMDFTPGKKYPVIFDIHGGPKTVYGPVFYHEMQYWASQGYFVIYCNPTGSDGRNAFSDIRGKYGTVDYEDLMSFCDRALDACPEMDRNNVFETGGSYGGFMTNWIIGHTDRFAACASQRSISNWFSFYGVSDIGVIFAQDQCQADPWGNPEKLWEHSPLKYADRCKTPTLFIHSFEDYRCPIDQGYQMYTALVDRGVPARLCCFHGENHELSRSGKPQHRVRRLKEITDWIEKYTK